MGTHDGQMLFNHDIIMMLIIDHQRQCNYNDVMRTGRGTTCAQRAPEPYQGHEDKAGIHNSHE